MTDQSFNAARIWRICQECAAKVQNVAMTPVGIHATATMLFGTAAQESALRYERQLLRAGMADGYVGGFSKWQVERGSVSDSLALLRRNNDLARKATDFLFADQGASLAWLNRDIEDILWAMRMQDNDHLGALFCRLHYLRVPVGIPFDVPDQARYWKSYYNTMLGAGKPEQYVANWERLCAATVEGR
jgi:hypothetical protein